MARLPIPGSDDGTWGDILNGFLEQAHTDQGLLKPDSVGSTQIQNNAITSDQLASDAVTADAIADGSITEAQLDANVQTKLNDTGSGAVSSVNGQTGAVTLAKADIGLGNADNTSDADKPVSSATGTALGLKTDKTTTISAGTGLSGGGDLSANRALALANTTVTPGIYTSTNLTVDATGRITSAANGVSGDMSAATYDPQAIAGDAFAQDNMTSGTTNKNYTATEQTKLAGIATGATANDTDVNLKARANHTGTQPASTISDFDAEVSNNTDVAAATTHIASTANPHAVTKAQVGLASADNTSDADKPVSTATQAALDAKADSSAVGVKVLLIDNVGSLPPGTPAGVVVVVKA